MAASFITRISCLRKPSTSAYIAGGRGEGSSEWRGEGGGASEAYLRRSSTCNIPPPHPLHSPANTRPAFGLALPPPPSPVNTCPPLPPFTCDSASPVSSLALASSALISMPMMPGLAGRLVKVSEALSGGVPGL